MNLEDLARRAVESAADAGATDAEAWVEESTGRLIRVYDGEVESLSDAGGRGEHRRPAIPRARGLDH